MERQAFFTITAAHAEAVIGHYEAHAKAALSVAEKLRSEVTAAAIECRPINKARFAAICRWYGKVQKQANGGIRQQEGSQKGC